MPSFWSSPEPRADLGPGCADCCSLSIGSTTARLDRARRLRIVWIARMTRNGHSRRALLPLPIALLRWGFVRCLECRPWPALRVIGRASACGGPRRRQALGRWRTPAGAGIAGEHLPSSNPSTARCASDPGQHPGCRRKRGWVRGRLGPAFRKASHPARISPQPTGVGPGDRATGSIVPAGQFPMRYFLTVSASRTRTATSGAVRLICATSFVSSSPVIGLISSFALAASAM